MEILYLSQQDVARAGLSGAVMVETVERVLRAKQAGRVEMPPKPGVAPRPNAFLHAMPGFLREEDVAGLKWIGYYPDNRRRDLPTINGLIVLSDPETGLPVCIMDGNWITAYRTAAVTALCCRLLAAGTPRRLGLLGCGVQAESHLELLSGLFPLEQVQVWGPNLQRARAFAEEMSGRHRLAVEAVTAAETAVADKDLVVSVTAIGVEPATRLRFDWLAPGTVVCPVEFDTAWDRDLFQRSDGLFADDIAQMEFYRTKGYFSGVPRATAEIADLLDGQAAGRTSPGQVLVAVNLGLGIMDLAFAEQIYRRAHAAEAGIRLPR